MNNDALGRLSSVDLTEIWKHEATDFTPWLAQEENLAILAATLGIDLELEASERAVGPFRADILCRDTGSNAWVLVENQLRRTDHNHLGQLLTYASGLEAVTIVWIASSFTEEHRATLDWLNRITEEGFNFFGLEIELWRIGNSLAAPKFNIVSKPNDWSQWVAQAARTIDEAELSDTRIMQRAYWEALHAVLRTIDGPISGIRKPQPQSWMGYSIGRSNIQLSAVMIRADRKIRSELYLSGPNAKAFFHLLREQREGIEHELEYSLQWEELPDGQDSRIAVYLDDVDPEDEKDWSRQHEWLAGRLNDLHRVFGSRVRGLDASAWSPGNSSTDRG